MRQRLAVIGAATGFLLAAGLTPASAGAATVPTTRKVGLAGLHFRVRRTSSLTVKGSVTVPRATCAGTKARPYELQVNAGFKVGGSTEVAAVLLHLSCRHGKADVGFAELDAGFHAKMPRTQIKPGQTVSITITVNAGSATARIVYPNHTTARVSDAGGIPVGAAFALTLPNWKIPSYAPVAFTACSANGKGLGSYPLKAWESITKGGRIDGKVSGVIHGSAGSVFSIVR